MLLDLSNWVGRVGLKESSKPPSLVVTVLRVIKGGVGREMKGRGEMKVGWSE